MISANKWLRSIVSVCEIVDDFSIGFVMGFGLGRFYEREKNKSGGVT